MHPRTLKALYDVAFERLSIFFEELLQTADGRRASIVAKPENPVLMYYSHISFF